MGPRDREPRFGQRAANSEKAEGHRAHRGAEGHVDRGGQRSPGCMALFLEMAVGLGARRGEVPALRWTDIKDGRTMIARSLTQTKA